MAIDMTGEGESPGWRYYLQEKLVVPTHGRPDGTRSVREPRTMPGAVMKALEGEKKRIANALNGGPMHPDELSGELGLPIEKLIGLLLELELSGDIYQSSDNQYVLA